MKRRLLTIRHHAHELMRWILSSTRPRAAISVIVVAAAICGADLFPISDRERLMRMVLDRKLEPERVVSHRMAMDDAAQAYQLFDHRIATKAVLYP